jgi:hypothetical protein
MLHAELTALLPGYNGSSSACHDADDDGSDGSDDSESDEFEESEEDSDEMVDAEPTLRIACNVNPPPEGSGRVFAVVLQRASLDFRGVRLSNTGNPDKALLLSSLRAVPAHIKWVEYLHGGCLTVPMDDPDIASALEGVHFRFRFCR